jgi:hypothetical protein
MIERHFDVLKEMPASIGHFDSGMMPVEQVDAQKVLKCSHALAYAGLANAKRLRSAAEAKGLSGNNRFA